MIPTFEHVLCWFLHMHRRGLCVEQRYICQSPVCRRESELPAGLEQNPICECGAEMKKVYSPPEIRSLSEEDARVGSEYHIFMAKLYVR